MYICDADADAGAGADAWFLQAIVKYKQLFFMFSS